MATVRGWGDIESRLTPVAPGGANDPVLRQLRNQMLQGVTKTYVDQYGNAVNTNIGDVSRSNMPVSGSGSSDVYGGVDPEIARQAERTKAEIRSDEQLLRGRADQDYRFTKGALDRALQRGVSEISNDFASRNMYHSGIRRGEHEDLAQDYANDVGNLNLAMQRELENLTRASTKGMLGVNTGLELNLFDSTRGGLNSLLQRALNDATARYGA